VEAFVKFNSEITLLTVVQSNNQPYFALLAVKNAGTIKKLATALISDKGFI
jgi:formate-dependent phosphoribosylglycinamide formyltransferase (GAR transformylase)